MQRSEIVLPSMIGCEYLALFETALPPAEGGLARGSNCAARPFDDADDEEGDA